MITIEANARLLITSLKLGCVLTISILLSSCLMTAPIWHQSFEATDIPIPLQVWTNAKETPVYFECTPSDMEKPLMSNDWHYIGGDTPSQSPIFDPQGHKIYTAGLNIIIPPPCWTLDSSTGAYTTAIRAHQAGHLMDQRKYFESLSSDGLKCLAAANAESQSWFAYAEHHCTTEKPYTIVIGRRAYTQNQH